MHGTTDCEVVLFSMLLNMLEHVRQQVSRYTLRALLFWRVVAGAHWILHMSRPVLLNGPLRR